MPSVTTYLDSNDKDFYTASSYSSGNFNSSELFSAIEGVTGNTSGSTTHLYFKFPLPDIPSNAVVTSAYLSLYTYDYGNESTRTFKIQPINTSWTINTVSWSNSPSVASSLANSITIDRLSINSYLDLDIKDIAQQWVNGSLVNNGMRVEQTFDNGGTGVWARFYSNERMNNFPKLTINYTIPPIKPRVISPNGGEVVNGQYNILIYAGKSANNSDQSSLPHYVELSTNNGITWKQIKKFDGRDNQYTINYDFSSEPETSDARIRVRNGFYFGDVYSEWDYSDNVFTIAHRLKNVLHFNNVSNKFETVKEITYFDGSAWRKVDSQLINQDGSKITF